MKKAFIITTFILFLWFTFDMTGLKIGNNIIVEKALLSADGIFWLVFIIGITLFIIKQNIGLLYLASYYLLWFISQFVFAIQYIIIPNSKRIVSYNNYFENTHHVIKPSEKILIPDTYHIVLFLLIIIALIISIIYSIKSKKTSVDM